VGRRYFTLAEANALLPPLTVTLRRMMQLQLLLRPLAATLDHLGVSLAEMLVEDQPLPEDRDTARTVGQARAIWAAIHEAIAEVEGLGVTLKDMEAGLVDFPALRDGVDEVELCWRLGEPSITHFHGVDAGFAGRQSVAGHDFPAAFRAPVSAAPSEPPRDR
jgi:hypothetical protein